MTKLVKILVILVLYSNVANALVIPGVETYDYVSAMTQKVENSQTNSDSQKVVDSSSATEIESVFSVVKEEYATDPISKTWNLIVNCCIEVSRNWVALPEGALPGFIPMDLVKQIAKQKKSYE